MSAASVKSQTLAFFVFGVADDDMAEQILDELEDFADAVAWPGRAPEIYKYKDSEDDPEIKCAAELRVRAASAGETIVCAKEDFDSAMALIGQLQRLSLEHALDVEVDFNGEMIGSIDKGVFSQSLQEGLIEPWSAAQKN